MKTLVTAALIALAAGVVGETTTEPVVSAATQDLRLVRGPGPGPEPEPVPDSDGHLIVIYTDDRQAGEARCDELEILEAPADCVVEPLSEQPDVEEPGWAERFREKWAGRADEARTRTSGSGWFLPRA
jgi:hypothetical protein